MCVLNTLCQCVGCIAIHSRGTIMKTKTNPHNSHKERFISKTKHDEWDQARNKNAEAEIVTNMKRKRVI